MICRFCGKKTEHAERCDNCSEQQAVMLNYRSETEETVFRKLRAVGNADTESVLQAEPVKVKRMPEKQEEQHHEALREKRFDFSRWMISGAAVIFIGVLCFNAGKKSGDRPVQETDMLVETAATESIPEETVSETILETETVPEIDGTYYGISDSEFEESGKNLWVDIFGHEPVNSDRTMTIENNSIDYLDRDYRFQQEDQKIKLESIDGTFLKTFPFYKLFGLEDDLHMENGELSVFSSGVNTGSKMLCNQIDDLTYGNDDAFFHEAGETCIFSLTDQNGRAVLLYENTNGDHYLRTLSGNTFTTIDYSDGDILTSVANKRYRIVRLFLEGEYNYFYQDIIEEPERVYMIQYIRYDTAKNEVQEAVLRDHEGGDAE